MRKLLGALVLIITAATGLAADVKLGWTNGDNPGATTAWQTIVLTSTSPSVSLTNYTFSMTNNWPATNATVTGLQAGRRYYFTVIHSDLEDVSVPSNEVTTKTKINSPKTLSVIP